MPFYIPDHSVTHRAISLIVRLLVLTLFLTVWSDVVFSPQLSNLLLTFLLLLVIPDQLTELREILQCQQLKNKNNRKHSNLVHEIVDRCDIMVYTCTSSTHIQFGLPICICMAIINWYSVCTNLKAALSFSTANSWFFFPLVITGYVAHLVAGIESSNHIAKVSYSPLLIHKL